MIRHSGAVAVLCLATVLSADVNQASLPDLDLGLVAARGIRALEIGTDARGPTGDNGRSDSAEMEAAPPPTDDGSSGFSGPEWSRQGSPAGTSQAELPGPAIPDADIAILKKAFELIGKRHSDEAAALGSQLQHETARTLLEWAVLRSEDSVASLDRYLAFIRANPDWPSLAMLRRRAEARLWQEHRAPGMVQSFFAATEPTTHYGRFAYARALLEQGDRAAAGTIARTAWRSDAFAREFEAQVLPLFREMLRSEDHKARMDRRLLAKDTDSALRAAQLAGAGAVALAKARIALLREAKNAGALLDALPQDAKQDPTYIFGRIQMLCRKDRACQDDQVPDVARMLLSVPQDPAVLADPDEWWIARRIIARKSLDRGDPQTAYRLVESAAAPSKEHYRAEQQFMAGWIALRFLNDPDRALPHFARLAAGSTNPILLSRSEYWQGRAAEAARHQEQARQHYEAAARFPTAYYGLIARARLGYRELALRPPPQQPAPPNVEVVRAIELLYDIGQHNLVISSMADLGERGRNVATLQALAELAARHGDARGMLLLGKGALGRGLAFDQFAFPTVGLPQYGTVGPEIDLSIAYSIIRQESEFNPLDLSPANAMGLMQVTPAAARYVAKKFGIAFDVGRLRADQSYNLQMGAAELGDLLKWYRGSYILAFAGYNAGRSPVAEWISRYGDPRDPNVDPIDWVERIPFSETRNYVQRVMENMAVYRVKLGSSDLSTEADLRRGSRPLVDADARRGSLRAVAGDPPALHDAAAGP